MRTCWLALVVLGVGLAEAGGALAQNSSDYVMGHAPREIASAVKSGNSFAFALEGRLARDPGNVFFSPVGVDAALSLLYGGAGAETARQMNRLLRFTLKGDTLHGAMGEMLRQINVVPKLPHRKAPAYELILAHALWVQRDLPLTEHFAEIAKDDYLAEGKETNFFQPEEARKTINAWAGRETRGRIPEVIPAGGVDVNTRVVLTNAIYFKGDWAHPFRKDATQPDPFHVSAQESPSAPLMHLSARLNYFEEDSLQVVELPYAGETLSMIVFLPKEVDGLARMQASFSPDSLSSFLDGRKTVQVDVSLPRFQISRATPLAAPLRDLGMADPFSGQADFSRLSPAKGIFIAQIFHNAVISVDETGTEAAAATAGTMRMTAIQASPEAPKVFRADHPFLFLIRHNPTGSILFFGRVSNPNG